MDLLGRVSSEGGECVDRLGRVPMSVSSVRGGTSWGTSRCSSQGAVRTSRPTSRSAVPAPEHTASPTASICRPTVSPRIPGSNFDARQ